MRNISVKLFCIRTMIQEEIALAGILLGGAKPFRQFMMTLFGVWTSGSEDFCFKIILI